MKRITAGFAILAVCASISLQEQGAASASPSGGSIVFTDYDRDADTSHLVVVNPEGSERKTLATPSFVVTPVWSPDGSKVLFATMTSIGLRPATINPDGSDYTEMPAPDTPSHLDVGPCMWVPRSTRILCHVRNFTTSDHSLDGIYSMDAADAGNPVRLTVNPYPPGGVFGGGDVPGDVSPDGSRFVFMRARPDPGQVPGREQSAALFVANIDGTGLRQITDYGLPNSHDNGVESWSPDGSTILFGGAQGQLFTIRPDGRDLSAIPLHGAGSYTDVRAPGWSPDGRHIVLGLYSGSEHRAAIYTVDPDGRNLAQVAATGFERGFVDTPDWGQ